MAAKWQSDLEVAATQNGAAVQWHVPEEAPVALIYNGMTFAVMLASPSDLTDFVIGFSLTEGIVDRASEIRAVDIHERQQGIDIEVTIEGNRFDRLQLRQGRRSLEGRTSCGLCGIDSAERLFENPVLVADYPQVLDAQAVMIAAEVLILEQPMKALNRSVHGAAFADEQGRLQVVREDVGRHNALDKLLGAVAQSGTDPKAGFILMTSRASFEIVEKATRFGATRLVALSAPTGFAIRRAKAANLTLANFSAGKLTLF